MLTGTARYVRRHHVALLALFLALGGTASAASTLLPRNSVGTKQLKKNAVTTAKIKNGAITKAKISTGAITALKGPTGKITTYDAVASGTPTITTLGTFLGVTLGASCSIPTAGTAKLTVFIQTTDGSWNVDYMAARSSTDDADSAYANKITVPAGTLPAGLTEIDSTAAASGGDVSNAQLDFVQLGPATGSMIWHETASTSGGQTCHFAVQTFPETVSAAGASARATAGARTNGRIHLGPR